MFCKIITLCIIYFLFPVTLPDSEADPEIFKQ